jgi:glutamate---cysteine ligase / carboxylate-amine ligase
MTSRVSIDRVLSVGVEEEFVLCDARDRSTVPAASDVLTKVEGELGGRVQRELYATQIEINSRPRTSVLGLRTDLVEARHVVAAAAETTGSLLVGSGTSVLTTSPLPLAEGARYAAVAERFASIVRTVPSESCGCHVHLGTLNREDALALSNHLRPWLPVIQALAVNSPYSAARDRGYASWRYFQESRWPTVGPAPLTDGRRYEEGVRALLRDGRILDRGMLYWWARPSEHLPTLEVRVADVSADVDVTVLIAMLLRGLATTVLAGLRTGGSSPARIGRRRLVQAHRSVARRGLAGWGVDPVAGRAAPLTVLVDHLVEVSRPGLDAVGDTGAVRLLLADVLAHGTGADRQRADLRRRGSLPDVVDGLARRTVAE